MGYPSDLSDTEWRIIGRLLPESKPGGRPRATDLRAVVNAISYVLRSGCAWRMLPRDFTPYSTAYLYFREWKNHGTWERGPQHSSRPRTNSRREKEESPVPRSSSPEIGARESFEQGLFLTENQRHTTSGPARRHLSARMRNVILSM